MGSRHQDQQTTNQYGYAPAAPPNPYYRAAEEAIGAYDGGAAGVREGYARNVNDINESGNSVFGANTPVEVQDKIRQSRLFRNNIDLGTNLSNANQNAAAYKTGAYMSLGGATAPPLVQLSGTSNTTSSGGVLAGMATSLAGGVGQGFST